MSTAKKPKKRPFAPAINGESLRTRSRRRLTNALELHESAGLVPETEANALVVRSAARGDDNRKDDQADDGDDLIGQLLEARRRDNMRTFSEQNQNSTSP